MVVSWGSISPSPKFVRNTGFLLKGDAAQDVGSRTEVIPRSDLLRLAVRLEQWNHLTELWSPLL